MVPSMMLGVRWVSSAALVMSKRMIALKIILHFWRREVGFEGSIHQVDVIGSGSENLSDPWIKWRKLQIDVNHWPSRCEMIGFGVVMMQ
jgi:hypothetical protein